MAQQTMLVTAFENYAGEAWVTYDDVTLDLLTVRLINRSADRTLVFSAQRGARAAQNFTAGPNSDTTLALPSANVAKYTFTRNADGSLQMTAFNTWAVWG